MLESYGLTETSWHPNQSIDDLLNVLKTKGAILLGGFFGNQCYNKPPILLKENFVNNRDLFGWEPGTYKEENERYMHSVLIVGGRREGKNAYVYFLNPNDLSPTNRSGKSKGKIYEIKLKRLVKSLRDFTGNKLNEHSKCPYGFHANTSEFANLKAFYSVYSVRDFRADYEKIRKNDREELIPIKIKK